MNDCDAVTIPKQANVWKREETHHDQHVLLADVTLVAERRGRDGLGRGLSSAASVNDDPPWVFRLDKPSELVPLPGEVDIGADDETSDGDCWLTRCPDGA